jgi:hypothetical protein
MYRYRGQQKTLAVRARATKLVRNAEWDHGAAVANI